ncbi:hypothetical protein PGR6_41460 [Pseudomonas sp. GR 6-02]|nr:hypothetical protein PGR6_41460 [Pseudomonas sp. GR 6-02]
MNQICDSSLMKLYLWRGSLLPLGCEAALKPADGGSLTNLGCEFQDRFALQREQAPSPQLIT